MSTDLVLSESKAVLSLSMDQRKGLFDKFILSGDVSGYNDAEKVSVVLSLCEKYSLDALQRPFDLIRLPDGRCIVYANKTASAIIAMRNGLTVKIVNRQMLGDMYVVTATASSPTRSIDGDGVVAIAGERKDGTSYKLKGDMLANKMMHASTKACRRAILLYAGLGMLDHSEIEDIEGAEVEEVDYNIVDSGYQESLDLWVERIEGCKTADELTATALEIKALSDALRKDLRTHMEAATTRVGCTWRNGQFWPNEVEVEA